MKPGTTADARSANKYCRESTDFLQSDALRRKQDQQRIPVPASVRCRQGGGVPTKKAAPSEHVRIDGSSPVASGTEMSLQVPGMGGKVRVFRADTAKSQSLTVGNAGFAVTRVAAG